MVMLDSVQLTEGTEKMLVSVVLEKAGKWRSFDNFINTIVLAKEDAKLGEAARVVSQRAPLPSPMESASN